MPSLETNFAKRRPRRKLFLKHRRPRRKLPKRKQRLKLLPSFKITLLVTKCLINPMMTMKFPKKKTAKKAIQTHIKVSKNKIEIL